MDTYPDFKRGELVEIRERLTKDDLNILNDFLNSCRVSAKENKIKDIERNVIQFKHITKKPFNNLSNEDLRRFLILLNQSNREQWTKQGIKISIKRFLKYIYPDWSVRFKEFKEVKGEKVGVNEKKINDKTLLTKQEIETIVKRENNLTLKTFFLTLYETGARPSEIRLLKWSDIKFGDVTEISIFMTKNKNHKVVFVKEATALLKKLQNDSKGEYIFVSREGDKEPISDSTAHRWISILGRHIDKQIYPYLLRHTRSQEIYDLVDKGKLSEHVATKTLGHTRSMREIYQKLKKSDLREAITKTLYNFEDLPEDKRTELENRIKTLEEKEKKREKQFEELYKKLIKLNEGRN